MIDLNLILFEVTCYLTRAKRYLLIINPNSMKYLSIYLCILKSSAIRLIVSYLLLCSLYACEKDMNIINETSSSSIHWGNGKKKNVVFFKLNIRRFRFQFCHYVFNKRKYAQTLIHSI